jgi:hypothetical protein
VTASPATVARHGLAVAVDLVDELTVTDAVGALGVVGLVLALFAVLSVRWPRTVDELDDGRVSQRALRRVPDYDDDRLDEALAADRARSARDSGAPS